MSKTTLQISFSCCIVKLVPPNSIKTEPLVVIFTLTVNYAVKSPIQFNNLTNNTGPESILIRDSIATQQYGVTAHQDDWSAFVPTWSTVLIPHIP